jgi:hypothetical protein
VLTTFSCASGWGTAYSNPPVEEIDGELRLSGPAIVNNFKKKIKAILNIALDNGANVDKSLWLLVKKKTL